MEIKRRFGSFEYAFYLAGQVHLYKPTQPAAMRSIIGSLHALV